MKPPWQWVEDDIFGLIRDEVKEAIDLDYKACFALAKTDGKKNEISRHISAFANSAGGTLIYGVVDNGHVPTRIDEGCDPKEISKEWLEQVINSSIQPRVDGIRINQIELPKSAPGKVLYAVSVPQSRRAPHMAMDHRFYKRFNFESRPMEEYEVRDVAHRSEAPNLHLHLLFRTGVAEPLTFEEGEEYSKPIVLLGVVTNEAPTPAEYMVIRLYVDSRIKIVNAGELREGPIVSPEGSDVQLKQLSINWGTPHKMPVWPGLKFGLSDPQPTIALPRVEGIQSYVVGYELHSPRTSGKSALGTLVSANGRAIIVLTETDGLVYDRMRFVSEP